MNGRDIVIKSGDYFALQTYAKENAAKPK
jgi:hypothetical protein